MAQKSTQEVTFKRSLGTWWTGILKPASSHRTKVPTGNTDEILVFKLSNNAAKDGYKFDTEDPIWICADNGSCPAKSGCDGQFTKVDCTATELTVKDSNDDEGIYRYQLNVLDAKNNKVPIDPIVDNGGKGLQ